MTDPLTACRERWWKDGPLTDGDLLAYLTNYNRVGWAPHVVNGQLRLPEGVLGAVDRLVGEVLRLRTELAIIEAYDPRLDDQRTEIERLRIEVVRLCEENTNLRANFLAVRAECEKYRTALRAATTDDSDADTPRSTGRRR